MDQDNCDSISVAELTLYPAPSGSTFSLVTTPSWTRALNLFDRTPIPNPLASSARSSDLVNAAFPSAKKEIFSA